MPCGLDPDLVNPPPSYNRVMKKESTFPMNFPSNFTPIPSAPPLETPLSEDFPSAPLTENFGPLLVVDLPPEYGFK